MDLAKYSTCTLEDFLNDDDFLRFVTNPSETDIEFWQLVNQTYPSQQEFIDEAANVIKTYRNQTVFTNSVNKQKVFDRIEASLQEQAPVKQKVFTLNKYLRVAAMLVLVSSITVVLWLNNRNTTQEIATAFGQLRTVNLPDGSVVVLNGNSKLSYNTNWDKSSREVWVAGEAFFNVKHINKDPKHIKITERFIVHCNDMNIEVLGTTFNVRNRHNKTNVGLVSGSIRLEYLDAKSHDNKMLMMKPGDYVEYAHEQVVARKTLPAPVKITEWTNHQLIFNNATLAQITEVMADDYGYHIEYNDMSLANLKIEGEISVPNVDELIETISTTLPVKITRTEKNISIVKLNP